MTTLTIPNGVDVTVNDDHSMELVSCMNIDGDGSGGNLENDPDFQPDTTYQPALNARLDRFIVVPPQVVDVVPEPVIGCRATVLDLDTNLWTEAVVGDVGPSDKIGEASIALAAALHVPSDPVTGGDQRRHFKYTIYPGVAACVHGKTYALQPRRSNDQAEAV